MVWVFMKFWSQIADGAGPSKPKLVHMADGMRDTSHLGAGYSLSEIGRTMSRACSAKATRRRFDRASPFAIYKS